MDLLFPPVCLHCSRLGTWLCERCTSDLRPFPNCRPPPLETYPGVEMLRSTFAYESAAESFVKNVKYSFVWAALPTMARLMDLHAGKMIQHWNVDALVPIPLHHKRQAWRGFNQSESLAQELGKRWEIPVLRLLERSTYRHAQAGSSRLQRQKVQHDFQLISTLGANKRLLLIDDVVTTGGTLSACARELEKCEPQWVRALTFTAA